MNRKRVIAVDFDDVVNNFSFEFLLYSQTTHGVRLTYDELYTYDYRICYGITDAVMHERIWDFCHQHHLLVKPTQMVLDKLRDLTQDFDLHLVTSRCESITEITLNWLLQCAARDIFTAAHFTNGFATLYPERRRTKSEVCHEIGAVALIDDAPIHAVAAAKAGLSVYVPGQPWNKNMPILPRMMWATSTEAGWQSIVNDIKRSFLRT